MIKLAEWIKPWYKRAMEQVLSLSAIRKRKASVSHEIDGVRRRLGELQSLLADLDSAEELVSKFGQSVGDDSGHHGAPVMPNVIEVRDDIPFPPPKRSVRDLVLEALKDAPAVWTDATEIQKIASASRGSEVPMGSISPTLSLLKSEGLVSRNGMKVALRERLGDFERTLSDRTDYREDETAADQ
ncbi:hypothetical protein E5A73_04645 [Sphingomonas gei]|uniref:Uncharacterized protein n=1 Tax=Sphingomonas gei TaxID=1395960 RepID=A0A4S1XDZ9_9SPHN|nr:hypothetical protein [Sphingomonas gei]TGX54749.1 hypothetical protein E5A73_04645 [Sphingomonas gei]